MEAASRQSPRIIDGRYQIVGTIGKGAMGIVYDAVDLATGAPAAVKVQRSAMAGDVEFRARFEREARLLANLKSPHIVAVHGSGETEVDDERVPYLVMEKLEGETLASRIEREGALPVGLAIDLVSQLAKGLDTAHAAGIVHRDLKPGNVFLVGPHRDTAKLLDFGVAKSSDESARLTHTHTTIGTPRYMAPEQADTRKGGITSRADQWSLALVTFEMLAGRPYFGGESSTDVLARVLLSRIATPSEVGLDGGAAFDAWFVRSCCRKPDGRFGSVLEQASELVAALMFADPNTCMADNRLSMPLSFVHEKSKSVALDAEEAPSQSPPLETVSTSARDVSSARSLVAGAQSPIRRIPTFAWGVGFAVLAIPVTVGVWSAWRTTAPLPRAAATADPSPAPSGSGVDLSNAPRSTHATSASAHPPESPTARPSDAPPVRPPFAAYPVAGDASAPPVSGETRSPDAGLVTDPMAPVVFGARKATRGPTQAIVQFTNGSDAYDSPDFRPLLVAGASRASGCFARLADRELSRHSAYYLLNVGASGVVASVAPQGSPRVGELDSCVLGALAGISLGPPKKAGGVIVGFREAGFRK